MIGARFAISLCLLSVCAVSATAQRLPARRSSNYDPNARDGRFDLRVRVDGSIDFFIRGGEIRYRVRNGAPPRDEGSEYRQELPRGPIEGLKLEQRDGRSPIRIIEEPSRRNNWTLVLSIDDREGGDSRYHARITWDDSRSENPFERDRAPRDRDFRGSPDFGDSRDGLPQWAIGSFRAERSDLMLRIEPDGSVTLDDRGRAVRGSLRDGRMRLGALRFSVTRDRGGIRVTEEGNPNNETYYRRIR